MRGRSIKQFIGAWEKYSNDTTTMINYNLFVFIVDSRKMNEWDK